MVRWTNGDQERDQLRAQLQDQLRNQLRERAQQAQEERDKLREEFEAFKEKVREQALAAQESEGWCDSGFNAAMEALGLPTKKEFQIPVEITSQRKRIAWVTVTDRQTEEEAREVVYSKSAEDLQEEGVLRPGGDEVVSVGVPMLKEDHGTLQRGDLSPYGRALPEVPWCNNRGPEGLNCTVPLGTEHQWHVASDRGVVLARPWRNEPARVALQSDGNRRVRREGIDDRDFCGREGCPTCFRDVTPGEQAPTVTGRLTPGRLEVSGVTFNTGPMQLNPSGRDDGYIYNWSHG